MRRRLDVRLEDYPILERLFQQLVDQIDARDWPSAFAAVSKLTLYIFYASKKQGKTQDGPDLRGP